MINTVNCLSNFAVHGGNNLRLCIFWGAVSMAVGVTGRAAWRGKRCRDKGSKGV